MINQGNQDEGQRDRGCGSVKFQRFRKHRRRSFDQRWRSPGLQPIIRLQSSHWCVGCSPWLPLLRGSWSRGVEVDSFKPRIVVNHNLFITHPSARAGLRSQGSEVQRRMRPVSHRRTDWGSEDLPRTKKQPNQENKPKTNQKTNTHSNSDPLLSLTVVMSVGSRGLMRGGWMDVGTTELKVPTQVIIGLTTLVGSIAIVHDWGSELG